jgi:hypothetical protein
MGGRHEREQKKREQKKRQRECGSRCGGFHVASLVGRSTMNTRER